MTLDAVPDDEARTAGSALGKLVQLERGRKNALEHLTVRALGPAFFCLIDELGRILRARGRGGKRGSENERGDARHAAIILTWKSRSSAAGNTGRMSS